MRCNNHPTHIPRHISTELIHAQQIVRDYNSKPSHLSQLQYLKLRVRHAQFALDYSEYENDIDLRYDLRDARSDLIAHLRAEQTIARAIVHANRQASRLASLHSAFRGARDSHPADVYDCEADAIIDHYSAIARRA